MGQRKTSESPKVIYKLHNVGLTSLCGSVVEHWSTESEGLRFNSSWGFKIFSLSHSSDNYFLVELKTSHLTYSIYKHDTLDVVDPCCMQDVCHIGTL